MLLNYAVALINSTFDLSTAQTMVADKYAAVHLYSVSYRVWYGESDVHKALKTRYTVEGCRTLEARLSCGCSVGIRDDYRGITNWIDQHSDCTQTHARVVQGELL